MSAAGHRSGRQARPLPGHLVPIRRAAAPATVHSTSGCPPVRARERGSLSHFHRRSADPARVFRLHVVEEEALKLAGLKFRKAQFHLVLPIRLQPPARPCRNPQTCARQAARKGPFPSAQGVCPARQRTILAPGILKPVTSARSASHRSSVISCASPRGSTPWPPWPPVAARRRSLAGCCHGWVGSRRCRPGSGPG